MDYSIDFTKISRRSLIKHFECEREDWLKLGMSEADIFRIHFGYDGKGGDYATWLAERKHKRTDHKFCPGKPLSIEDKDSNQVWIGVACDELSEVEMSVDIENALSTLTELQRYCFVEVCLKERSYTAVAKERNRHHSTIQEAVSASRKKLKKLF